MTDPHLTPRPAVDEALAAEELAATVDATEWTRRPRAVPMPDGGTCDTALLRASARLELLTPAGLSRCLAVYGLLWTPAWADDLTRADEDRYRQGLYCWVVPHAAGDHLHAPILYIGVGTSATGCLTRLRNERSWRDGVHGHGRMQRRLEAKPLVGAVDERASEQVDLAWAGPALANDYDAAYGVEQIRRFLASDRTGVAKAEALAIRLAIAVGDTGAPVNSAGASAWDTDHGADWAAVALERWIADRHQDAAPA